MRWLTVALMFMLLSVACATTESKGEGNDGVKEVDPDTVVRIPVAEAREKVQAGTALLVSAYDDDSFEKFELEGAIKRGELEAMRPSLPLEQEIIFYCA